MFNFNNIHEGVILKPKVIDIPQEKIRHILVDTGIKSPILSIDKPFTWIMQSQHVFLEDGRCLLLKIGVNPEWTDKTSILNQVMANKLIRSIGISKSEILAYSIDLNDYGFLFILSERQTGNRLCDIYSIASEKERVRLYGAVGQAYSQIHNVKNEWAGIWDGDPGKRKYPIHPCQFYQNAEFHNGSARYLLNNGVIDNGLYEGICSVWDDNLDYLINRPNSLVHVSPFPWTIYIKRKQSEYSVTGFSALGDFMWWDSMADVAHLINPPFMDISEVERYAFTTEYGLPIDEYAIKLYTLLNRVCAMSGCYFAPMENAPAKVWIQKEKNTLQTLVEELRDTK